ncbi:GntR family transcriptional regulator [Tropicimonas sp.]|uniref:GntR family transcriptional regulator n=1 Tax=Tropicimonas sp. TaxID=2067044 RepID=UPI003A89338C
MSSAAIENTADQTPPVEALASIEGMTGPLSQRVYTALRKAILDLTFPPGTVLRKAAICARFGVSRSPVAEAITLLGAEGLVEVIPQSATRVARFSLDEIREESFLRDAIETTAAARVAEGRTDDQLAQLTRNLRLQGLLVEDRDYPGFLEADEAFHTLILSFTGYRKAVDLAGQLSLKLRRARLLMIPDEGRAAAALAEHTAIVDAIRAGDGEAATRVMRHHLSQLLGQIEPLERAHPDFFLSRGGIG